MNTILGNLVIRGAINTIKQMVSSNDTNIINLDANEDVSVENTHPELLLDTIEVFLGE